VILNGVVLQESQRDSALARLRQSSLDSLRVFPATDSLTIKIFGSRGVDGVVIIGTRPKP